MKEELELKAQEALLRMLNGLDSAMDFTVEQAPLVVQELLAWNFVYSLSIFSLGVLILTALTVGWYKALRWGLFVEKGDNHCRIHNEDLEPWYIVAAFLSLVLYLIPLTSMFHHLDWLKIWIAPRVWLLEYAAALVK